MRGVSSSKRRSWYKNSNILLTVNTDGYITVKVEPGINNFEFIGPDANIPRVKEQDIIYYYKSERWRIQLSLVVS